MNVRKPRPTAQVNHTEPERASDTTEMDSFQKFGFGLVYFAVAYFAIHAVVALFR